MAQSDLNELFSKIRYGDKDAFSLVYQDLKQPVFTICWRITQSRETAEDITHDVFVKLYTSPPGSSVKNVRAWVFRMARNLSIDSLRKKTNIAQQEDQTVSRDEYSQIHMRMDLESAISKLSCEEREILSLHLNADLSFNEIAQILNLSLPATYRKYQKALKSLSTKLNGG